MPALPAAEAIPENPKPEDAFILLYTSGSTGTPKGVAMGMEAPRFLVPGDEVACTIEGIGEDGIRREIF